jgi:hypothetical protein
VPQLLSRAFPGRAQNAEQRGDRVLGLELEEVYLAYVLIMCRKHTLAVTGGLKMQANRTARHSRLDVDKTRPGEGPHTRHRERPGLSGQRRGCPWRALRDHRDASGSSLPQLGSPNGSQRAEGDV